MANELKWEQIRDILYTINNTEDVYYDPPSGIQMTYPCFRFVLNNTDQRFADNCSYLRKNRWAITYITRDVEDLDIVIKGMLDSFRYCTHETTFRADNLHQAVFNLYF